MSPGPTEQRKVSNVAERFARALDADDFAAAREALSPDCRYLIKGMTLKGPAAIIKSYREASEKARRMFDRVEYGNEIVDVGDQRVVVKFLDHLEKDGHTHCFSSQQILNFDADGRIVGIEHLEIPSERENLVAFMARWNLKST